MSGLRPTVDEVIGTLQRSTDPTLLAEGVDDIAMLRRLEDDLFETGLSIMPMGGRAAVLEVFRRRNEIPTTTTVLFLADKDLWLYKGIPAEYDHDTLLFTDGYSIENDLYRDGQFERLLTNAERIEFGSDLSKFLKWYAIALGRKINGNDATLSTHPRALIQDPNRMASETQLGIDDPDPAMWGTTLTADYKRMLRGKSLMALIIMRLSHPSRTIKHSSRSLMEHGAVAGGEWFSRIKDWVQGHLERSTNDGSVTSVASE